MTDLDNRVNAEVFTAKYSDGILLVLVILGILAYIIIMIYGMSTNSDLDSYGWVMFWIVLGLLLFIGYSIYDFIRKENIKERGVATHALLERWKAEEN